MGLSSVRAAGADRFVVALRLLPPWGRSRVRVLDMVSHTDEIAVQRARGVAEIACMCRYGLVGRRTEDLDKIATADVECAIHP
ncbi:hypothetical protein ACH4A7_03965 [Streptomyces cyaneofuscatus]|uniref:hypothetical protein n=1 Tax=Streptomyces cyaneofuscatus TaxID=66883 RepID=UPI0037B61173